MDTEYEIKILDIDVAEVTKALEKLGFTAQPKINFRRYIYNLTNNDSWIRLRTDGIKTTLTLKLYESDSIEGVKETEVMVEDFDNTNLILEATGLKASKYQENRRTLFTGEKGVEISVDEWPMIPAYLEIEAKDEATVKACVAKLQLEGKPTTSAPTSKVYARYSKDLDSYEKLVF